MRYRLSVIRHRWACLLARTDDDQDPAWTPKEQRQAAWWFIKGIIRPNALPRIADK